MTVLASEQVLDEVERALAKSYFARKIAATDRAEYVAMIRREAVIVTGDRALRDVGSFRGVEIVSARELIEILGR